MEANPGFGTKKKCPFSLNRGVAWKEVTNTKIMWKFFWDQILCPLNRGVPKGEVPSYHESVSINDISKVNVKVHSHFLTVGYCSYCTNINSPRSIHCISKFYHDTEVLRSKLQIFHNSIVPQFPEETWAQRKPNQNIEKWENFPCASCSWNEDKLLLCRPIGLF